jgi:transcriptional regulator with XRE-family HTH domain
MIDFQFMPESYRQTCIFATEQEKSMPMPENATLRSMRSEFGQRLFDARKHAGLTQQELASAVGTSQANLGELEKKGAGSALTPALAKRCGVSVEWLAYGHGDMQAKDASTEQTQVTTLSSAALELAMLFDLIPLRDRIKRAQAFGAASAAILDRLESPSSAQTALGRKRQLP